MNMILFEYKYTSSSDIINNFRLLTEYSVLEYIILIVLLFILISMVYYIIPITNTYVIYRKKEAEKYKRKEMIKKIVMQKDINDEIEKELNIH